MQARPTPKPHEVRRAGHRRPHPALVVRQQAPQLYDVACVGGGVVFGGARHHGLRGVCVGVRGFVWGETAGEWSPFERRPTARLCGWWRECKHLQKLTVHDEVQTFQVCARRAGA
jgi:hypothetical protein